MMGCCLFVYYRKKRKQTCRDADSLSLCSLDINEPSTKRGKLVSRVTSLASLLPPVKTTPLKRIGQTLQRSISFRGDGQTERAAPPHPSSSSSSSTMKTRVISAAVSSPSCSSSAATRVSTATAPGAKRRDSKLWSETFDVRLGPTQPLSSKEIKRQEAIFELAQGEQDLVEDLKLAKKAYHDPMLKLSIMTEQELNHIFGTLDSLIPLHEDLLSRLRDARKPDGSTEHVGHILTDWLPCLASYTPYCCNQVQAKALLDQKKQDRRVQDFLQRCLQSPFSRKLDLWNFLDIPRSRLVKYPLLLREILKHTANDHQDRQLLEEAMLTVQSVVADINRRTGESECQFYKDRLLYAEDGLRDRLIDRSRTLSCHGELKNQRGIKLHVFLFQDVLVITRSTSLSDQLVHYQLCRQPIPIRQLDLEDLSDGEMRVGGSIRGAFSNTERTKNFFRVSFRGRLQSHCFQASDAFNKQQWINCIRQAKEAADQQSQDQQSQDQQSQDQQSQDQQSQDQQSQDQLSQDQQSQDQQSQDQLSQDQQSQDQLSQDQQDQKSQDQLSQDQQDQLSQDQLSQDQLSQDQLSQDQLPEAGQRLEAEMRVGLEVGPEAELEAGLSTGLEAGPGASLEAGPEAGLDSHVAGGGPRRLGCGEETWTEVEVMETDVDCETGVEAETGWSTCGGMRAGPGAGADGTTDRGGGGAAEEEEEEEAMEEQSGAEVVMETSPVASPQDEELSLRC